jgi:hypothetical protein
MLAAGRSLRNEPILISHLVQLGMLRQGIEAVALILGRASLTDSQLARLSQAFADTIDPTALPRVLAGERAYALGDWDRLRSEVVEPGSNGIAIVALRVLGEEAASDCSDRAAYIRIMAEVIKNAADPLDDPADINAMRAALGFNYVVARSMVSVAATAVPSEQKARAEIEILRAALAAKRYQLAHGKLPARLDELVPQYLDAMPADPFDGKPLRYKLTDTGAAIYSVGRDGTDDRGHEYDGKGRPDKDGTDIVFKVRH